ncbi:unknown [Prevotella sp. CAG:1031]|nr:unknown [Prevotella sp. CAG:1031]
MNEIKTGLVIKFNILNILVEFIFKIVADIIIFFDIKTYFSFVNFSSSNTLFFCLV